ncbi:MAG: DUF4124 domain-containing protein [Gammaproteobacteria bacterium]|nr:DUF4124 domain-containing protein [Gammaproteobacteria bacterium]MBV8308712.1 DUF4124 domain-containing protein [Gammaproteobacteria bacterium]MBV8403705.1 DUF4124 domain-containing protein [Gammaproteobacteria bacterium]
MLVAWRLRSLALLAAAALGAAAWAAPTPHSSSSSKGIAYRWVDEQGVVHYGDNIPPQYASQDRAILNSQGVEVGHLDAQKSPEEEAVAARAREALMKQKQHDAFLVSTYTSVKDIEALRDVRLDQLKGQRAALEQYLESLRGRLATLQSRVLAYRPYNAKPDGRRMPDDLAENLVHTVNELRVQSSALSANSTEEATLRAQFQSDIERYRELHAIHSQAAVTATAPRAAASAE